MEELDVLKEVALKLNDAGIPYMVSGSMAMNYYAMPRMTRDIDVVAILKETDVQRFVSSFKDEYYIEEGTVRDEASRLGMFNLIHSRHIIKIDFIMKKGGEYHDTAFARRRELKIDDIAVFFISPEDLVICKCLWAKDSGSETQAKDVRNILETAEGLDLAYIRRWVETLKLGDAYKRMAGERYA